MSNMKDLARIVSDRYDLSLSDSENFITEMFELVRTTLSTDDTIKIKGLGTFKVQTVRDRASVNVNTGEKVIINSHDRITFTPDNAIRDAVNRPFAHFTTVPLNDGVEFEDPERYEDQEEKVYQKSQRMPHEGTVPVSPVVYDPEVELAKLPDATPETLSDATPETLSDATPDTLSVVNKAVVSVATDKILQMEKPDDEQLLLKRVSEKSEDDYFVAPEETPLFVNNPLPEELVDTDSSEALTPSLHQKEDAEDVVDIRKASAVEVQEAKVAEKVLETKASDSIITEEKEELKEESRDRDDGERDDEGGMSTLMTTLLLLFVLFVGIVIGRVTSDITFDDVEEMVLGSGDEKEKSSEEEKEFAGEQEAASSVKEKANVNNSGKSENSEKGSTPSEERVLLEETPQTKSSSETASPSASGSEKKEQSSTSVEKNVEGKAKPASSVVEWPMDKFDSDVRIRTGAYYITGVKEVVTVRSGQTLKSLSRYYLGEGMECYLEALNGVKEVKEGQKIKIPSLKLKKKKK